MRPVVQLLHLEELCFNGVDDDFDAGIGSKSGLDSGYNTGDLDQLSDAHSGWPGHVVTIWVR